MLYNVTVSYISYDSYISLSSSQLRGQLDGLRAELKAPQGPLDVARSESLPPSGSVRPVLFLSRRPGGHALKSIENALKMHENACRMARRQPLYRQEAWPLAASCRPRFSEVIIPAVQACTRDLSSNERMKDLYKTQ